MLEEYQPSSFLTARLAHAIMPAECKSPRALLRWWQPYDPDQDLHEHQAASALTWIVDNILVDRSDNQLSQIYHPVV